MENGKPNMMPCVFLSGKVQWEQGETNLINILYRDTCRNICVYTWYKSLRSLKETTFVGPMEMIFDCDKFFLGQKLCHLAQESG